MVNSVFLVIAERGEYSDYTTWVAAACMDQYVAAMTKAHLDAERAELEKQREAWEKRFEDFKERNKLRIEDDIAFGGTRFSEVFDAAVAEIGDPPEGLSGAEFSVLEVPVDCPGEWWPER